MPPTQAPATPSFPRKALAPRIIGIGRVPPVRRRSAPPSPRSSSAPPCPARTRTGSVATWLPDAPRTVLRLSFFRVCASCVQFLREAVDERAASWSRTIRTAPRQMTWRGSAWLRPSKAAAALDVSLQAVSIAVRNVARIRNAGPGQQSGKTKRKLTACRRHASFTGNLIASLIPRPWPLNRDGVASRWQILRSPLPWQLGCQLQFEQRWQPSCHLGRRSR